MEQEEALLRLMDYIRESVRKDDLLNTYRLVNELDHKLKEYISLTKKANKNNI